MVVQLCREVTGLSSGRADRVGWITQLPVILQWDAQPQMEDVEQFLKGSDLTLKNTPSSTAFPTSTLYQPPTTSQAY
jgi:hypothetical protein